MTAKFSATCDFIAGASNTRSHNICWFGQYGDGVIAYSCSNTLLIVEAKEKRVVCVLRGHDKMINCVAVSNHSDYVDLASGGDDGRVTLWRHWWKDALTKWTSSVLVSLKSPIKAMAMTPLPSGSVLTVSELSGVITSWASLSADHLFAQIDSFVQLPAQMAASLHLLVFPEYSTANLCAHNTPGYSANRSDSVFLLLGSVDARIYVYHTTVTALSSTVDVGNTTTAEHRCFTLSGSLAGHEEWVTCLHSTALSSGVLLIASGSQDSKVRLWRLEGSPSNSLTARVEQAVGEEDEALGEEDEEEQEEGQGVITSVPPVDEDALRNEARLIFTCGGHIFRVLLEALCVGHEDWVTAVHWLPIPGSSSAGDSSSSGGSGHREEPHERSLQLFSTSMDRNMVLWRADPVSQVWTPIVRIGDIGGQLGGSVGGNLLGFVGGAVHPRGGALLGVGYGGTLHLWRGGGGKIEPASDLNNGDGWRPVPFLSGHFGHVNDLSWVDSAALGLNSSGNCLMTGSADQTTRVFALVLAPPGATAREWREVSRPQVHGYEINCLGLVPPSAATHPGTFRTADEAVPTELHPVSGLPKHLISAGDEKYIRIFEPPICVVEGIAQLCGIQSPSAQSNVFEAYVPELGLSTRAAQLMTNREQEEMVMSLPTMSPYHHVLPDLSVQAARRVSALTWQEPPLESQLTDCTLWPEVRKLYGHVNDVICLAVSHCGALLASACKAKDRGAAAVLLWDLQKFVRVGRLEGHESSVVTLQFSPTDRYLLSAGKDRAIHLYRRAGERGDGGYTCCCSLKNSHKRIVWDSCWASETLFLTGSRDGLVKVWHITETSNDDGGGSSLRDAPTVALECAAQLTPFQGVAVTALGLRPLLQQSKDVSAGWLLALGSESGDISLWLLSGQGTEISLVTLLPSEYCHGSTVRRVKWCTSTVLDHTTGAVKYSLASCSEDCSIRVFRICSSQSY